MNTIAASLAALKEGSALAARIPYMAPIAGLILQALAMHDASIRLSSWILFLLIDVWLGG
jgi:hypothetical protein